MRRIGSSSYGEQEIGATLSCNIPRPVNVDWIYKLSASVTERQLTMSKGETKVPLHRVN